MAKDNRKLTAYEGLRYLTQDIPASSSLSRFIYEGKDVVRDSDDLADTIKRIMGLLASVRSFTSYDEANRALTNRTDNRSDVRASPYISGYDVAVVFGRAYELLPQVVDDVLNVYGISYWPLARGAILHLAQMRAGNSIEDSEYSAAVKGLAVMSKCLSEVSYRRFISTLALSDTANPDELWRWQDSNKPPVVLQHIEKIAKELTSILYPNHQVAAEDRILQAAESLTATLNSFPDLRKLLWFDDDEQVHSRREATAYSVYIAMVMGQYQASLWDDGILKVLHDDGRLGGQAIGIIESYFFEKDRLDMSEAVDPKHASQQPAKDDEKTQDSALESTSSFVI